MKAANKYSGENLISVYNKKKCLLTPDSISHSKRKEEKTITR